MVWRMMGATHGSREVTWAGSTGKRSFWLHVEGFVEGGETERLWSNQTHPASTHLSKALMVSFIISKPSKDKTVGVLLKKKKSSKGNISQQNKRISTVACCTVENSKTCLVKETRHSRI